MLQYIQVSILTTVFRASIHPQVRDLTGSGELVKTITRKGEGVFPVDCPVEDSLIQAHWRYVCAGVGAVLPSDATGMCITKFAAFTFPTVSGGREERRPGPLTRDLPATPRGPSSLTPEWPPFQM